MMEQENINNSLAMTVNKNPSSSTKTTFQEEEEEEKMTLEMPEDLIIEILFKLPVKSLGRFKCLSNKWNHFISYDPYFCTRYTDNDAGGSPRMLGLFYNIGSRCLKEYILFHPTTGVEGDIIHGSNRSSSSVSVSGSDNNNKNWRWSGGPCLPFDEMEVYDRRNITSHIRRSHLYMIMPSNGFLLCSLQERDPQNYYICNPITKQCIILPRARKIIPRKTDYQNGFLSTAFISRGGDDYRLRYYKVVRVIWKRYIPIPTNTLTVEILCSDDQVQQWKQLNLTCSSHFFFNNSSLGTISDATGVVYFQTGCRLTMAKIINMGGNYMRNIEDREMGLGIVGFDDRQEDHELVLLPLPIKISLQNSDLEYRCSHTNGHIVYVLWWEHNDVLTTWEFDEQKNVWYNRHKIEYLAKMVNEMYPNMIMMEDGRAKRIGRSFHVLASHPLNSDLLLMFFKKEWRNGYVRGKMVWFNVKTLKIVEFINIIPSREPGLNDDYKPPFVWPFVCPSWPPSLSLFV